MIKYRNCFETSNFCRCAISTSVLFISILVVVATNDEEWLNRSQYNPQSEGQPRSHVFGSAQ